MKYKKGQSGNPGGRPKTIGEVQTLARSYTKESIEILGKGLKSKDWKIKVACANSLLDRAWGKSPQAVTGEGGQGPIQHVLTVIRNAKK